MGERIILANTGDNRDIITGRNVARPQHNIAGCQWSDSSIDIVKGKRPAEGPPMMIGNTDPFINADTDEEWIQTFGGSLDNVFSLMNGNFVKSSIDNITLNGVHKDGRVTAASDNLWLMAANYQQVQHVVSQDTVIGGSLSTGWFGNIEELRGFGMRLPVLAAGYGRTVDGLPTDPLPEDDPFGRLNDAEHKLDRATWKHGPIELRWDPKRGVWTGYNELIADQYDEDVGTWVFGTLDDSVGGFPFLRGKLDDVFWVRQPTDRAGANGRLEGVITGEVFTHLDHRWYDNEEEGVAALSSIFIIPHKNSTTPGCHDKGAENTLGTETTGDGLAIDIRHTAHFFKEVGMDGPILFDTKASQESIACEPSDKKYHLGKMIFKDVEPAICSSSSSQTSSLLSSIDVSEGGCNWVPAIAIEECELMGGHLNDLIWNDVRLGVANASLCASLSTYTTTMQTSLDGNFLNLSLNLDLLQDNMEASLAALALCLNTELLHVWTRFDIFRNELDTQMEAFETSINDALAVCCEGESVEWVAPDSIGSHDYPDPCKVVFDRTISIFGGFPVIECTSCPPIDIWTPCSDTTNFVQVGGGCNPTTPIVPTIGSSSASNARKSSVVSTEGWLKQGF